MPGGEIQLVAYGEENMYLNDQPQVTFFKVVYRRYTNFSIETVQTNFIYQANFGKKISCELSKLGDLIHKMWLIIELPDIPILYDLSNSVDKKLKFAWARKIAYALIDYVEIEISGQIISRMWGEWFNVLNELNYTNFNSSLNQYIGNIPELYTLHTTAEGIKSYTLHIPMYFWFCNNSGMALPILCLEYNTIRFNIQLNDFSSCAIFSPTNYIKVQKYYGNGIVGEPLIQYSQQGIAWAEFDSIDTGEVDKTTMNILNYNLYYRKISDNSFITTTSSYLNNLFSTNLINIIQNGYKNQINYIIYGTKSGSIYIPVPSVNTNPNTIYIEKNYFFKQPIDLPIKNIFLLIDYIYLDRDERNKFYNDKHEYIIEQVFFTGNINLQNLSNRNSIQILNPCKWLVFMAQISYLQNPNVNDFFNYKNTFLRNDLGEIEGESLISSAYLSFNSIGQIESFPMSYYNLLQPFYNFPMAKIPSGFGVSTFSLYPINIQASGSCNMSYLNTFDINTIFKRIDVKYNKYIFKTYGVTHNVLRIVHGVSGTIFNSNY
jgi:hypothetical protein